MKELIVNNLVAAIPTVTTSYNFTADTHEVRSIQIITASSTASWSMQLLGSNDNTNFTAIGAAITVANNSANTFNQIKNTSEYLYYKMTATKTSGTLTGLSVLVAYQLR